MRRKGGTAESGGKSTSRSRRAKRAKPWIERFRSVPVDERSRDYATFRRGLERLRAGKKPTDAQALQLADERRRLARVRQKRSKKTKRLIDDWYRAEAKLAARKSPKGQRDLFDRFIEEKIKRAARGQDTSVYFVPADRGRAPRRFSFGGWRQFVRRPYYRKRFEAEFRRGKFVVGEPEVLTGKMIGRPFVTLRAK